MEQEGDKIALAYVYAVIARKLIFFDIVNVTAEAEDEIPDDFWQRRLRLSNSLKDYHQVIHSTTHAVLDEWGSILRALNVDSRSKSSDQNKERINKKLK